MYATGNNCREGQHSLHTYTHAHTCMRNCCVPVFQAGIRSSSNSDAFIYTIYNINYIYAYMYVQMLFFTAITCTKTETTFKVSRAAFQGVTQFRKGSGQHCPEQEYPTTLLIPFNKVKLTLFHTSTHTCMHTCIDKYFAPFCVFVVVNINTGKYKEKTCLCL